MIIAKRITDSATNLFPKVASLPWCQLLQSGGQTHVNARFDILVADPLAYLQTFGEVTHVTYEGHTQISDEDPFKLCLKWRNTLLGGDNTTPCDADIPFTGGALGLWGYDLGRQLEPMPTLAKPCLNTPDMAIGIYDWAVIYDHKLKQSTLIVNHIDGQAYWQQRLAWLETQQAKNFPSFKLMDDWQTNLNQSDYETRFNQIQDYLRSGDCYQINLTQQFNANYAGSELEAYLRLYAENQGPFSAFIRLPNSCILSVSPERFIALHGEVIETKPIKGTRPRNQNAELDAQAADELHKAVKDRAENVMIVDLLRNDIGRVSTPGSVHVPKLFDIESFPAVHHLVSTVTGLLKPNLHAEDLLRSCFPGGSITGAPKVRAMQIIEELEPHRRNAYCGSIGYIDSRGHMDSNITIRTLLCEAGKIYAWAGGGIVADSTVEAEYQECFDKLSRILPALR